MNSPRNNMKITRFGIEVLIEKYDLHALEVEMW